MLQSTQPYGSPVLHEDLALKYLLRLPKIKPVIQKALIVMHGVGSNESDLFRLFTNLPDDLLIISARAGNTLGPGRYAWFRVDFSTGKPVIDEEQEKESRASIKTFISQVRKKYSIDKLYIGGFSQGAIMSCSVGLTSPGMVKGVIALSGRIVTQIRPLVQKSAELSNLKVFLSHGLYDNTLPVSYAREAKAYLESLGVQLIYHEYPIGHLVNKEVFSEIEKWIG